MKYRIEKIHPHQAGKIGAALFAALSLLLLPLSILILHSVKSLGAKDVLPEMSPQLFFLLPVFYGLLGYLLNVIVCLLYNLFSRYVGALQLDIVEDES